MEILFYIKCLELNIDCHHYSKFTIGKSYPVYVIDDKIILTDNDNNIGDAWNFDKYNCTDNSEYFLRIINYFNSVSHNITKFELVSENQFIIDLI